MSWPEGQRKLRLEDSVRTTCVSGWLFASSKFATYVVEQGHPLTQVVLTTRL